VRFACGDVEALPLRDGTFDLAMSECSLCTFPDKPGPSPRWLASCVPAAGSRLPM
jgi:hypothetical protein